MSKHPIEKHRRNCANIITFFRVVGIILLLTMKPLSPSFFLLYTATGLTDVLDGWIARKTKTASDFGARLDSIADLLFYTVVLFFDVPIPLEHPSGQYLVYSCSHCYDTHISLPDCGGEIPSFYGSAYEAK